MQSVYKGMKMNAIAGQVKAHLAAPTAAGINQDVFVFSEAQGQRDWNIQKNLSTKNFMGNVVTRVQLPGDPGDPRAKPAPLYGQYNNHQARVLEERRQHARPWESIFMPSYANRLNNPAQSSFMKQPQLAPPSTYGQFYAFMHALSAAFGTLQQGGQ